MSFEANLEIYKNRPTHFCISSHPTREKLTFTIFDFEKVGQGHGIQLRSGVFRWQISKSKNVRFLHFFYFS